MKENIYRLLFPKEMFGYQAILSELDGKYYTFYDSDIVSGDRRKHTFTKEEIDAIPFNTDMFTKVETEK